jgi:hypothetical protein
MLLTILRQQVIAWVRVSGVWKAGRVWKKQDGVWVAGTAFPRTASAWRS